MSRLPSLVAFGSLSTCSSVESLQELYQSLSQDSLLQPINDAIHDLPKLWEELLAQDESLSQVDGLAIAKALASWVSNGKPMSRDTLQSNIARLPLTISRHIREYLAYVKSSQFGHSTLLGSATKQGGFQGFCVGLLSALAVAGSASEADVASNGAFAVRLAFILGIHVELDAVKAGQTTCLALRWKSGTCSIDAVQDVLNSFEGAYISVIRDTNEVTITVPNTNVNQISQSLGSKGVSILNTNITGRYHSSSYSAVIKDVAQKCKKYTPASLRPQASVRSNNTGAVLPEDEAVELVVEEILTKTSNWPLVFKEAQLSKADSAEKPLALVVMMEAVLSSIHIDMDLVGSRRAFGGAKNADKLRNYPADAVAITGMSCKFPGADGPDEFWQLLTQGTSMVEKVPEGRWPESISSRGNSAKGKFWGNFLRNIDQFDHKFFKKSSREASSMDPQQRLLLQGAYEAMESSGYFSKPLKSRNQDVGCYLGLCAVDYDQNVQSHQPTAYSTLGSLRAFLSGKISHYFGWFGPSLTFDTACSSSAVAIHTACKALQAGECTEALAGGVALFTTPYLYENLAAAHFLSSTGACKPFDAKADGYCRGEGVGLVVLKKLSKAIADGDEVLAVIGGSAVNQNANCVPITVPNAPSQASLYFKAARQAGIDPQKISFVEAHGTGTPVGDPIEMDSIRTTFCGPLRRSPLYVSSVKGNIGHLEGASGVAGLIKAVLQIQHRMAPRQASFQTLNPSIPPLGPSLITIPTSNMDYTDEFLTACVNNYGAAGSNSTIMLLEPFRETQRSPGSKNAGAWPIQVAANTETSLKQYLVALNSYISQKALDHRLLPSVSYALARRTNQNLPFMFSTSVSNMRELSDQLTEAASKSYTDTRPTGSRVVLAFGGQVRDYAGLGKDLWENSTVFRSHVDRCDEILRGMGYESLYPAIFQQDTISDIVTLHVSIFALQYASAQAWIDSGLQVEGVIGHSLGQLAALAVSGILSLQDGLKFVAGRASLMKKHWGPEGGSMILVEADADTISNMRHSLEIACHNARSSHVLVGSKDDVDAFEGELSKAGTRFKRLQVTHGFHSKFTDPLIAPLKELAGTLRFNEAKIPIETCTEGSSWEEPSGDLLAAHTRDPVFFHQAVERLAKKSESLTWLEVGFDSGITSMARRAMEGAQSSKHAFVAMSAKQSAVGTVVDATLQLWKRGHSVQYWNFHSLQKAQYQSLRLPSYQWEKTKHWLELVAPAPPPAAPTAAPLPAEPEVPRLVRLLEQGREESVFRINPRCDEFKDLVSGHVVASSPLCPATVYIEVAARALKMITPEQVFRDSRLGCQDIRINSPLGMASEQDLTLTLTATKSPKAFDFKVVSQDRKNPSAAASVHVLGTISLQGNAEATNAEFARYERLTGPEAINALQNHPDAEAIRGPTVYKIFSRVVEYSGPYRGLKSVTAHNGRITGTVAASSESLKHETLTNPPVVDSWMQISGINANNFHNCPDDEVYVFTKLDHMQFGFGYEAPTASTSWLVYSNLTQVNPKELSNDIFVFDSVTKQLVVLILGARFNNVRLNSLRKALSRVNGDAVAAPEPLPTKTHREPPKEQAPAVQSRQAPVSQSRPAAQDSRDSIFEEVCLLFERVAEVPRASIKGDMTTDDMGVDSLMMMEVISELSAHFAIDLPLDDMVELTTVDSLTGYLRERGVGGKSSGGSSTVATATPASSSVYDDSTAPTSRTSTPPPRSSNLEFEQLSKLLQEHLELPSPPKPTDNLADMGLDSLLAIELGSDIEKMFSTSIDLYQIDETSTVQDLAALAGLSADGGAVSSVEVSQKQQAVPEKVAPREERVEERRPQQSEAPQVLPPVSNLPKAQDVFEGMRLDFDKFSKEEGFTDFWTAVYPDQARLVLSYTADAFKKLGCDLAKLRPGEVLPRLTTLDKHRHLVARLHHILVDGGYIEERDATQYTRTTKAFDLETSSVALQTMLSKYPLHASEHRLLNVTGAVLAECLTGKADPLALLFANRANRQLLADVYDLAPMCRSTTRHLARFLEDAFPRNNSGEVFHFLEVGGGTGGTSRFLVEYLTRRGIPFTYTFTDVSSALVNQMKKQFTAYDCMRWAVVDAEKPVSADLKGKYHAVISTNCIHATRNATSSLSNLRQMLRPDGLLALVEFTRGLYWFDLVYGLLDGWWLFSDGRKHALADTAFWDRSINDAGYGAASWSDGDTAESRTMRIICGFNSPKSTSAAQPQLTKRGGIPTETVTWKEGKDYSLQADIYYPQEQDPSAAARPIALLFHGGGHVLFTRKDIHLKHIKSLLARGFLPISFDYRLCPETTLTEGPMTDARDALSWARTQLPNLRRALPDVRINPSRIAAIGWSAGGHLAMTLSYTAPAHGISPPEAVLAFYCPSNFEDAWWRSPILPDSVHEAPGATYDLLEGIQDRPLVGYKPKTLPGAPMTLSDPRWRIIIHYNWKAQLLPVLIKGLPTRAQAAAQGRSFDELPAPTEEEIRAVSPLAQIRKGNYKTPTFIIHGDRDDLIPWTQSRDTIEELKAAGVEAGIVVPEGAPHAFDLDLWGKEDGGAARGWDAVGQGWDFVQRFVY